jgi:pyruvate dehydrogenase E2 component (dihydrolipoamide acetyltransferase)
MPVPPVQSPPPLPESVKENVLAAPVAVPRSQPSEPSEGERLKASPLARRMAKLAGIDLSGLVGSGPRGRIVAQDIEAARGTKPLTRTAPVVQPSAAVTQGAGGKSLDPRVYSPDSYELIPLDGMRKVVAKRMTESFRDVPHFPLTIDLEIDNLLAARARLNDVLQADGIKVSVNDFVIRAAALALKRVPAANASYTPDGIAMHRHVDISVAVAIEGGLITPVVRTAELKGLAEIAVEVADLASRARARKLKPEEYQGGTFSISNLGMFGIRQFASILNEPQGCIMSVGSGEKRPVVRGDTLSVATVMTVTLTCDHRVVDGSIGAQFLAAFKGFIQDPVTMLA